jgi:glycosyltransferase involved in cell wall biosynthesis
VAASPRVTIAIPTYNRLTYLRQTLDSALSQTYANLEIVVSDNCSSDGTAAYVSTVRDDRLVFLVQERNLGMAGNWNACLERATGEFFLLLSDDDYLEPSALAQLAAAIVSSEYPERIAFAYCRTWEVDAQGDKQRIDPVPIACEAAREFAIAYFEGRRKVHLCSTLMRTADLREIGGYTQGTVVLAVDAIAWSRVLVKRGFVAGVPVPLSNYRIHSGSETSTQRIDIWRADIASFTGLWSEAFAGASAKQQRRLKQSAAHYTSWAVAATINQSAKSLAGRFRALAAYSHCRSEFKGRPGAVSLARGLFELFLPELIKRPLRRVLLAWAKRT